MRLVVADYYKGILPSVRHADFARFAHEMGLPEIADWFCKLPSEWPEEKSVKEAPDA